jgi:hypothetical protein
MTTRACTQCGQPLAEKAKFCSQCGQVADSRRSNAPTAARTLLAIPQLDSPASPSASSAAGKRTIVGLPSLLVPTKPDAASPAPAAPAAATPSPPAAAFARKTMLGIALPGIAPMRNGEADTAAPAAAPPQEAPASAIRPPPAVRGMGETLPLPAFFVPPPAPLVDTGAPMEPALPRRRGAPLMVAALAALAVAAIGGTTFILLWHGSPPITAQPRVAPDGNDVLHLTCEPKSCEDGTTVSLQGMRATFVAGEADLHLASPLRVGDNTLALAVDRPGMGRDETIKLVVPVAYRVRADVTTMEATPPSVTIRVEAPDGTDVKINDKPIALDAEGAGTYVIDESEETAGPADESRPIAIDVPYLVTPKGRPTEKGTVSARIAVAPLRVDAPGATSIIEDTSLLVAGRAAKGARVTVDGASTVPAPDGAFESTVAFPSPGTRTIEVRAGTATLASRTVRVKVTRVASLAEAAKAFEARQPLGYDSALQDLSASKTGDPIVVEGDVVEARGSGHRTLILVDDHRGCAKGPCLARVIVGRDLALSHGESLAAYGEIARPFRTPAGQTVPEVEAEFVVRSPR